MLRANGLLLAAMGNKWGKAKFWTWGVLAKPSSSLCHAQIVLHAEDHRMQKFCIGPRIEANSQTQIQIGTLDDCSYLPYINCCAVIYQGKRQRFRSGPWTATKALSLVVKTANLHQYTAIVHNLLVLFQASGAFTPPSAQLVIQ